MSRDPAPDGPIAVVGATGAVGREVLSILAARGLAPPRVRPMASARSAGTTLPYGDSTIGVGELTAGALAGCSLAIFAADARTSLQFVPAAIEAGVLVVDNSSAFRMDPGAPLVIPEVNGNQVRRRGSPSRAEVRPDSRLGEPCHQKPPDSRLGEPCHQEPCHQEPWHLAPWHHRLFANPNCTTIILLTALEPLRRAFGVEAIDVATYQAVSGAGLAAIDELHEQTRRALQPEAEQPGFPLGRSPPPQRVFAEPCAFNVFSHDSAVDALTGVNGEERKVIDEARKIWDQPGLRVTPTCVRVPVVRAHTEAITVTLASPAGEREVREALAAGEGIVLLDDRAGNSFPTPSKATERDPVLVGRIRPDPCEAPDRHGRVRRWCLLACGDQLRKGAALNALQIAQLAVGPIGAPPDAARGDPLHRRPATSRGSCAAASAPPP